VAEALQILATPLIESAVRRAQAIRKCGAPEDLHKLRVILRRMRSLWWAYAPLLDTVNAQAHRDAFKEIADAAGETRSWDILRTLLDSSMPRQKVDVATLLRAVEALRIHAISRSCAAVDGIELDRMLYGALSDATAQLDSERPLPSVSDFARERVAVAEEVLIRRWRRAKHPSIEAYADLHRVRIACKKVRYLLEFFMPVLGSDRVAAVGKLESIQEALGRLNDLVASEALIHLHEFQLGDPEQVRHTLKWIRAATQSEMQKAYESLQQLDTGG
jgi:CHAD domain-containing protein